MVREMKEWGLDVKVEEAGSVPVGFNRGPWFGRMLSDEGMQLHFVTPTFTVGTKGLQRGHVLEEPLTQAQFDRMKGAIKGAWILISGTNTGWPIDRSPRGDSIRAAIKAENERITAENRELQRRNYAGEENELKPYREFPALFYKELCEAGALGFIQSSTVPIRALYDRTMINLGLMDFDHLPAVPDIKLDEHQFNIIRQMAKERREFLLEFDIRNH
jgi:hypothetical protein